MLKNVCFWFYHYSKYLASPLSETPTSSKSRFSFDDYVVKTRSFRKLLRTIYFWHPTSLPIYWKVTILAVSQGTELLHGDYSSVCPNFSLLVFELLNAGQLSLSGELCSQRYWNLDSDLPFALELGENFPKMAKCFWKSSSVWLFLQTNFLLQLILRFSMLLLSIPALCLFCWAGFSQ